MEASSSVLRGQFTDKTSRASRLRPHEQEPEHEWCERRLLARIHRLTVATLRKQIEPVTSAQFMRWRSRWQHITPGSQVQGERATLDVLRQLQGFEIPASAWERHILGRRISNYDPKWLDQLCLTGAVGWGRLSPHPATLDDTSAGKRRVIPTSVAPITFFVREEADWMTPHRPPSHDEDSEPTAARGLSEVARQLLEFLRQRGASFFADIVRGTGRLKAEVETGLWELVAGGLITADGFDNLRSLIDPETPRRARQRPDGTSAAQHRQMGAVVYRPGRRSQSRGRSHLLDAPQTLRHCLSRLAGARDQPAQVAGIADGFPPPGGSGRDSRRTFRRRLSGRAVCVAGRCRVAAGDPKGGKDREKRLCYRPPTLSISSESWCRARGFLQSLGRTVTFTDGAVLQTAVPQDSDSLAVNLRVGT